MQFGLSLCNIMTYKTTKRYNNPYQNGSDKTITIKNGVNFIVLFYNLKVT